MSESSTSVKLDLNTLDKIGGDDADKNEGRVVTTSKSPPKSASKRQQKEAEKAERLRLKEEKDKQKTEEKMKKEKEKNDLKLKKEAEKREKEEKRKQKEEEKKQKEEEKKQKEEEKRIRQEQIEEERRKKEEIKLEEKKKKEEIKQKEEERIEKKAQKEKELMKNFFIKMTKDLITPALQSATSVNFFMPFELKPSMRLAPITRYDPTELEKRRKLLEVSVEGQNCPENYLTEMKRGVRKPGKSKRTWPLDEDVVLVQDECPPSSDLPRRKMKLLQFHDNYRPAYCGTWSKKSCTISGRKPLALDPKVFDYDFDSDEEWEEEEPGESISHSEGEEDGDEGDGNNNDDNFDKFMVPHGYLSDDEGCDKDEDMSPEALRQKRQLKAHNWEVELAKNVHRIIPVCIGVVNYHQLLSDGEDNNQLEFLRKFTAQPIDCTFPIALEGPTKDSEDVPSSEAKPNGGDKRNRALAVPDVAMADLIKLVHGCGFGMDKIVKEFRDFWSKKHSPCPEDSDKSAISKRQLEAKIKEIASYKKDSSRHAYRLWYVDEEVLEKYGLSESPVPSEWEWSCRPSAKNLPLIDGRPNETPKKEKVLVEMKTPKVFCSPVTPKLKSASGSIKKFMTPTAEAVSSAESAKRRVEFTTLVRTSGSVFTPGENAVGSILSKRIARKRSSSGEVCSESKRLKRLPSLVADGDSRDDCVIVDGPSNGDLSGKKGGKGKSCYVKLFRCGQELPDVDVVWSDSNGGRKADEPMDAADVMDLTDENEEIPQGSKESATIPKGNKMLTSFFKTLSPLNK